MLQHDTAIATGHEHVLREAYKEKYKQGDFAKPWGRKAPVRWLQSLKRSNSLGDLAKGFPTHPLSRTALRDLLSTTSDHKTAALLVLAWGEMRADHARKLLDRGEVRWIELVSQLRSSQLSRRDVYKQFKELAEQKAIPGLGPAYFTKLIYFLRPTNVDDPGFIMDRWTATSINLLFDKTVKMDRARDGGAYVSHRNTPENYEQFCICIETIAHRFDANAEHIEMTLFGRGGESCDPWRKHVSNSLPAGEANAPARAASTATR